MSEPAKLDERSHGTPWQTALSVVIGAALGSGVYLVAEARHSKQQTERFAQVAPLPAAAAVPARPATLVEAAATALAHEPKEASDTPAEPEDPKARALAARTAAEQALLDEARAKLDSNNAAGALATLDRMKKRFTPGGLIEERELLRIEVYKARGQMPAAKRAARKFAKAYPESLHLGELEALTKI